LIDFDWDDGNPVYRRVSKTGGHLQVHDPTGTTKPLKQLEPWDAERTLGVRLAPDGNMDTQFEWMASTARSWADKVHIGQLPRHLTWQAWKTTILKTLEYPLPSTTLSRAQCSKLNSIMAQAALPHCGIVRSFPRDLLHAPLKTGGLNIPDLYVEQGIAHVLKLIRYSKSARHPTGLLLRQTCEALKMELGTNGFLLSNPLHLLPLATNGWIKATWKFAQEYGIQIQDDIPDFRPRRVNDILLISLFDKLGLSSKELQRINQCRLFLKLRG
jgi:hypothetical protein